MYLNLLEEWNQYSNEEINQWLATKTFDVHGKQNLQMSGTYLQHSIKAELWQALKPTLQGCYKGPRSLLQLYNNTKLWSHQLFMTLWPKSKQ